MTRETKYGTVSPTVPYFLIQTPQSSTPGKLPGFIYMSGYADYPAHKLQMCYFTVFRCTTCSAW